MRMHAYMYVPTYIYVCVHIHVCVCTYTGMCIYLFLTDTLHEVMSCPHLAKLVVPGLQIPLPLQVVGQENTNFLGSVVALGCL